MAQAARNFALAFSWKGGESLVVARLRHYPGVTRIALLLLVIAASALLGVAMHQPVNWEIAIVYGAATGVSRRWPLVMPKTGNRITFLTGLLFQALWTHGIATVLVLIAVDFLTRVDATSRIRSYWQWYQPIMVLIAVWGAYGIYILVAGTAELRPSTFAPPTDSAAFLAAYSYWCLINAGWAVLRGPKTGRERLDEFLVRTRQGWWVPISYLASAWLIGVVGRIPLPLIIPACLLMIWAQSLVGPSFTGFYQDRTVSDLVRTAIYQGIPGRGEMQRAFRLAGVIAREFSLSADEVRIIGYAAMLQDRLSPDDPQVPLWFAEPPTPAEVERIKRNVEAVCRRIEQQGGIQEPINLIKLRHTAYDGKGYPPIAGEAIPLEVQILSAANALAMLTDEHGPQRLTLAQAVTWIQAHASGRFSPEMLGALERAFIGRTPLIEADSNLPQMVRELRGLIRQPSIPSPVKMGLRRLWTHLRDRTGWFSGLPDEVLAVARLASFFASSTTVAGTAGIIVEAVGELVGGKVLLGLSAPGDESRLIIKASYGLQHLDLNGRELHLQSHIIGQAIVDSDPIQIADLHEVNDGVAREIARSEGVRSVLVVPMSGRERIGGHLLVGLTHYHWFTPREVGLIQLMAGLAAIALDNANLIDEVADRLAHISALKNFTDTLLDNLSTAIAVVEPNGSLRLINRAARNLYDPGCELVVGEPVPDRMSVLLPYHEALEGRVVPERDVAWGDLELEVQAAPLRGAGGELLGAICLARDVTLVRRMEQQVRRIEKLAAMGELAAGAAHEIRNPLTSIRGFIQLAGARHREDGEFYDIVLSEIDRIDSIIRDMLLLARPAEPQRTLTSLEELIDEVLRLHDPQFRHSGVRVVREYESPPCSIMVDPKLIRQVLLNLILNAVQAMPDGGLLRISLHHQDAQHVALTIADTGVGISEENMKKLFVPFFTTKDEGTGLGLALCYGIVRAHDGRIDVQSAEGKGTTFTVTLPV